MASPPTVVIRAHTDHVSHGSWTVPRVLAALCAHESGDFATSALLADALGRDPDIAAPLRARSRALTSRSVLPVKIEEPDGGDARVKGAIREAVESCYWDVLPEYVTAPLHADSVVMEMALGFMTWSRRQDGLQVPTIHPLTLHNLSLEWNLEKKIDEFIYVDADGKRWVVNPGDGTWLLHLPSGVRSYMHSALRALGMPFALSGLTWRDWARFCEKLGIPIMMIEEPGWASDDLTLEDGTVVTGEERIRLYYKQFANFGRNPVFRLPQGRTKDDVGFKAALLEYTADSSLSFDRMLDRLKARKDAVLLGRDVASAAKASGDGAKLVEGASYQALASDAEGLSTTYRQQIWKPFTRFNWGDRYTDSAPWSRWDLRALVAMGNPEPKSATPAAKPKAEDAE